MPPDYETLFSTLTGPLEPELDRTVLDEAAWIFNHDFDVFQLDLSYKEVDGVLYARWFQLSRSEDGWALDLFAGQYVDEQVKNAVSQPIFESDDIVSALHYGRDHAREFDRNPNTEES